LLLLLLKLLLRLLSHRLRARNWSIHDRLVVVVIGGPALMVVLLLLLMVRLLVVVVVLLVIPAVMLAWLVRLRRRRSEVGLELLERVRGERLPRRGRGSPARPRARGHPVGQPREVSGVCGREVLHGHRVLSGQWSCAARSGPAPNP